MTCELRAFIEDESRRADFQWRHVLTIGHVVSEFMFSLNAATYLSVHVTIETGASSAAELMNAAFWAFPCFAFSALAILIPVQVPGLDFVACVRARVFAGFLPTEKDATGTFTHNS